MCFHIHRRKHLGKTLKLPRLSGASRSWPASRKLQRLGLISDKILNVSVSSRLRKSCAHPWYNNNIITNSELLFRMNMSLTVNLSMMLFWSRSHQPSSWAKWWESQCIAFPTKHPAFDCQRQRTILSMTSRLMWNTSCELWPELHWFRLAVV